jgi:hypothetical protein
MSEPRRAYSSTVTSRWHLAVGLALSIAVVILMLALGSGPWLAIGAAVACIATAAFVSTVRLMVGNGRIVLGQGPLARPRRSIAVADVVSATTADLTWSQVFGLGVPRRGRATRMTVQPGPTLVLVLASREEIRISTPHPDQAVEVLTAPRSGDRPPFSPAPGGGR